MGRRWVTAAGTIRAIAEIDRDVAARIFGSHDAIALGGWPGATTGRSWANSARFAEDVANETIPDDLQVAMYGPEHWDATPLDEPLDPYAAIDSFGTLARSKGYTVLIAPHPNLVSVPGSPLAPKDGETRESAYLRSGIVEVAAANGDVIETQAQTLQPDPDRYRAFVAETVRIARATKRDLQVLSGLSTHPGYPATVTMLRNAWKSVRDVVDGHYRRSRACACPRWQRRSSRRRSRRTADGEDQGAGVAIGAGLRQLVFVRQIT
jgi:hypothetical protein